MAVGWLWAGEQDMDVPIPQSEEYFIALRKLGVPCVFVRYPREGHGIEVLQNYSGPASILGEDRPEVTTQMLLDYFAGSKYAILLDWVAITYLRKLELSIDKKRALQQIRLTSNAGESVPVTFQLSKHDLEQGSVWLIDQLLVKS